MNTKELKNIAESLNEAMETAGALSIKIYNQGLKIKIKEDGSPVTNGDIEVNKIITEKIKVLTPNIPIVSEETVDLTKKNKLKTYWLIDPIDGTKEYISGKDEYTLNAGLIINKIPTLGVIGVPKKNRIFYSFGKNNSFLIEGKNTKVLNCKKKTPNNEIIALTNHTNPPDIILKKLKNYGMTSFRKLSSSYKYCVIANGEFDIYADKVQANEWDDAAGHAIAEHAGALVTDLENNYFEYGREDYKNPTILIRRSDDLNA
ncbi:MAG: 3'(2'),5'-bisphosphate nucleotidase CysQ [Pelagibacterales bacterium MED-G40]|nr:MAG: 3'(2'),5'-bisphosphate nucleotidase CysQ [Pelagibacterales bacterium MED-G40]|tara:strand:+ start:7775 stop:8554 length:780 start_codon:yes stop_codon:yes gene_type:complete